LGTYEVEKRRVFEAIVEENGVVFDIGAHVGFYTLLASVLVGPGGKVIAFEPLPGNLNFLKRHLRLNYVDNVTVVDAAVCDRSAAACFEEGSTSSMGRISPTGAIQVRTVALDDLVSSGQLPVPDYIKVDVEGAEMSALSGAKSILERFHPTLFLAVHTKEINRQCCRFLRALDYGLTAIDGTAVEECDELLARLPPPASRTEREHERGTP
jgi:FkbM family methyltransferase